MNSKTAPTRRRTPTWLRRIGRTLSANSVVGAITVQLAVWYLRFVFRTNKWSVEPEDAMAQAGPHLPAIAVAWHGQHILLPAIPFGLKAAVMISRNSDGEITARVARAFGAQVVRASGGRQVEKSIEKGSMKGFLDLLSALKDGQNVMQTADIPHGTPRRVGRGVVALAKHSGRPIIPLAIATSRRWVARRAWDRTTVNLPFGRGGFCMGAPLYVPAQADDADLEKARQQLEAELARITKRAYDLSGRPE